MGNRTGFQIYHSTCMQCHSGDTRYDSIGPSLALASKELLLKKVLDGEYPSGYSPKRDTNNMPKFRGQITETEIENIYKFLNEAEHE